MAAKRNPTRAFEGFVLDKNGKRQDKTFWEDMLGTEPNTGRAGFHRGADLRGVCQTRGIKPEVQQDRHYEGFDRWRDNETSEPDCENVQSFDSWYRDQYGIDKENWDSGDHESGDGTFKVNIRGSH